MRRGRFALMALAVLALVAVQLGLRGGSGSLPRAPDYHSLLVSPADTRDVLLGTHDGLFRSRDGGRTWTKYSLGGKDAMNLAQAEGDTVWAAGHNVLARSADGGITWRDVRPRGLPHLDLHGFAVDPRSPLTLYAAVAGEGLYRSRDGGASFSPASRAVGGSVFALAVLRDGTILAGDAKRRLVLASRDGGKTWAGTVRAEVRGFAVGPDDPKLVLASGPGVLRSHDGGRTWKQVLRLGAGTGPIAWAPGEPSIAYVVAFDRTLYRSSDRGVTWQPVAG